MSLTIPADDQALASATRKLLRSAGARLGGRYRGPDPKIRRDSFDVDDPRAQVASRVADGTEEGTLAWIDAYVRTAQEFDDRERAPGGKRPFNPSGVRVLYALLRGHFHNFKTGEIDPAITQLMKATSLAKDTVVKALASLQRHGFICWVRRTERVENPIPGGPTRQQTNNAYFVELGKLARDVRQRFLQLYGRARQRVVLRRKQEAQAAPSAPPPAPAPDAQTLAYREAIASLGRAVDRRAASPIIGQSPAKGVEGEAERLR